MKRIWLTLALLGTFLLAPASRADDVALTAIMRTHKMSAMEAAAVVVIADALKLDADFVISTGRGSGVSPVLYGPALIYSHHTHRPFMDVWRERNRGWGQVAHSIGMHPGTFNKLRKSYSVNDIIWMQTMNRRYGIPYSDYGTWRSRGYSDGRIFEIAVRYDGDKAKIGNAMGKPAGKGGPPDAPHLPRRR